MLARARLGGAASAATSDASGVYKSTPTAWSAAVTRNVCRYPIRSESSPPRAAEPAGVRVRACERSSSAISAGARLELGWSSAGARLDLGWISPAQVEVLTLSSEAHLARCRLGT